MGEVPGRTSEPSLETSNSSERCAAALDWISGNEIEAQLISVAQIGGNQLPPREDQPLRYAANRLALSEMDRAAQNEIIRPFMEEACMDVDEHPLGLIGTYAGKNPDLEPLVILSHTDSVPIGDMYDGVLGVMGGIEAVKAIRASGYRPQRNIIVALLTGEESAAFGFACFGSRSMFQGLTDEELESQSPQTSQTIRQALGLDETTIVRRPTFGPNGNLYPAPHAVIELHVEQDDKLERQNIDLGIVEAIAAPVRYQVTIGDVSLEPDATEYPYVKYAELTVNGQANHSGATPMGSDHRADGLAETAEYLLPQFEEAEFQNGTVSIGSIDPEEQAMNKIPGVVKTLLRITGESDEDVRSIMRGLNEKLEERNAALALTKFGSDTLVLREFEEPYETAFFDTNEIMPRYEAALKIIAGVREIAQTHRSENVVGTIGTFNVGQDGSISLGLDLRGINLASRGRAETQIRRNARVLQLLAHISFGNPLAGSGEPVVLDPTLVKIAEDTITRFEIGTSTTMFSAAGHDTQNAARAGIPSVMVFCQSRDGIAHHPDAYTSPQNLERGVKALAALAMRLSA